MAGKKSAKEEAPKKLGGSAQKQAAKLAKEQEENEKKSAAESADWSKGAKSNAKKYLNLISHSNLPRIPTRHNTPHLLIMLAEMPKMQSAQKKRS